jgi:hypothetical protein
MNEHGRKRREVVLACAAAAAVTACGTMPGVTRTPQWQAFNTADVATFRRKLGGGFYQRWKSEFGATAWNLMETQVGTLN